MATDDLPLAAVQAERGRDAQIERRQFTAAAHLRLPMLLFEQRDELGAGVARDLFEYNALAVAEIRRCEVERLRDRRPAARHAAEWIRQQHILSPPVERLDRRGITNRKRVTRSVVLLDQLLDIHALRSHISVPGRPHARQQPDPIPGSGMRSTPAGADPVRLTAVWQRTRLR